MNVPFIYCIKTFKKDKIKTANLLVDCFSVGKNLLSRAVASRVSSARTSLTSVFGMGTGGPSSQSIPTEICWQKSIVPGRCQPSIVDVSELNFCVRDGNRWTLVTINTNLFLI